MAATGAASSATSKQASYNRADVKIYTRTGDAGETSLFDGTRVSKHDARVDAYGEVDELNAGVGVARSAVADPEIDAELAQIQRDLFAIGARLADPAAKIAERVTKAAIVDADVARLEGLIDRFELELPPLRRFILAGGSPGGAALHLARAVCRRLYRRIGARRVRVLISPHRFPPKHILSEGLDARRRPASRRALPCRYF